MADEIVYSSWRHEVVKFDGDLVMLTDNPVLVRNLKELPTLMCVQRKAQKTVPDEEDFIRANIESFGNEIGQTTNWITSMYEIQSKYDKDSTEYKTLEYRIRCGQLIQQNVIDKSKGIVAKSMPRSWHDRHSANAIEDEQTRMLYRSIVAEKKPYFMRYIYPQLMKQYNTYINNTNRNALREFQMTVPEVKSLGDDMSERQKEFIMYFDRNIPVGTGDCVMNKICKIFEDTFDKSSYKQEQAEFDYSIMKGEGTYTQKQFYDIKSLYSEYNKRLKSLSMFASIERIDSDDIAMSISEINQEFREQCEYICPNRFSLCNLLLDLCYTRSSTKRFVWSMCGDEIIHNLLSKSNNMITWPELDPDGDIYYCGKTYSMRTAELSRGEEYELSA